jgi:hypothetical protein
MQAIANLESNNLYSVAHDPATNELHVEFIKWVPNPDQNGRMKAPGSKYVYSDVPPAVFDALDNHNKTVLAAQAENKAPDRGLTAVFNELVKNGGFKYTRL